MNNVFFRQRSKIMDDAALDDAETSLRNMLRDFLEDTKYSTKQVRYELPVLFSTVEPLGLPVLDLLSSLRRHAPGV